MPSKKHRFNSGESVNSSVSVIENIVPADGVDLAYESKAIYVGTGGDIAVICADMTTSVVIPGVANGTLLPVRVTRVLATGTTASNIQNWYG